jgi:hypothetical protein
VRHNPYIASRGTWLVNPDSDDVFWFHGGARITSLDESARRSTLPTSAFYLSSDVRTAGFFLEMFWHGRRLAETPAQVDVFRGTPAREWPRLALSQMLAQSAITACKVRDVPLMNADQLTPPQVVALVGCLARAKSSVDLGELAASYNYRLIENNPALVACIRELDLRGWFECESSLQEGAALNMALLYPAEDAVVVGDVDLAQAIEPALRRMLSRQLQLIAESVQGY